MTTTNKIPPVILKILANEWCPLKGYSSFDMTMKMRPHDPSYYCFYKNSPYEINYSFTNKEAILLTELPMLEGLIFEYEKHIALNEHAQHALSDFCSEVYDCYRKLQKRIKSIPRQHMAEARP